MTINKVKPKPKRIPCLDGIRAISITLVLLAHFVGTFEYNIPEFIVIFISKMGNLGVRIFFVISGFLISSLLINEYEKTGTISLVKFYFNRTFRIFPAFYVYILVIVVANAFGYLSLHDGDLFHAVTYTTNYHYDRAWELGHLWSLAVEEQFYLLWPVLFLLFGMRGAFNASIVYLVIGPIVRIVTWKYFPDYRVGIGESFQTIADAIAAGCAYAFVKNRMLLRGLFDKIQSKSVTPLVFVVLIGSLNHFNGYISFMYPIGETILNISIVLIIDWCLRNQHGLVGRLLEARPFIFVGMLSYSLYLWQQLFLNKDSEAIVTSAPINVLCALLCALLSYYFVESPFLRVREKIAGKLFGKSVAEVATPGRNSA